MLASLLEAHETDGSSPPAGQGRRASVYVLGLLIAAATVLHLSPAAANRLAIPIEPYAPSQEFLIEDLGLDSEPEEAETHPAPGAEAEAEAEEVAAAENVPPSEPFPQAPAVGVEATGASDEPAPAAEDETSASDVDADLEPSLEEAGLQVELDLMAAPSLRGGEALPSRFSGLLDDSDEDEPHKAFFVAQQRLDSILIVRDPKVDRHIQYFNSSIRDRFHKWLIRLGRYRPMVESVFAEFGLPLDLAYLSLVESGFNPRAYSRARATGPWQFMKGTARLYGLKVSWWVDERRDPIKSTVAAARYLRDLYDLFGNWPLAMAAYNAGEGRVGRALRKTDGESFYEIARSRYIRRETKEYVPRFMAATIIAKNPDQYGFPAFLPDPHQFEEVIVSRPLHMRDISKATRIPFGELRSLNPELRRYVTPPRDKEYHLKVPVGTGEKVASILDQIPSYKKSTPPRLKKGQKVPKGWYRVRWGDSLWKIARRFRTTVRELMAINNLRSILIRPGDLLAIRP